MTFFDGFREFLAEERAASEWSSLYMLIVVAIAAVLIISLIKPMFKSSQQVVAQSPVVQAQQSSQPGRAILSALIPGVRKRLHSSYWWQLFLWALSFLLA